MTSRLSRLLITGITGFIGSQLAVYARAAGYNVTGIGLVRDALERKRRDELAAAGIDVLEVALDNTEQLREVMRGQEAVIHLAAAQHETDVPDSYFSNVNVEGTKNLLALAEEAGVSRFLYGSTIGIYGEASEGELSEDSPPAPANAYSRTKLEAEQVVGRFNGRCEVFIARISETYGPGDLRLLKLFRAIATGRYLTIGNGRNEHQPIFVEDLCRALLTALQSDAASGQTLVLAGEERVTTDGMVEAVGRAVGHPAPGVHLPLWPFSLAASLCAAIFPRLGINPPLHPRRLDFFRKSFRFSTARAAKVLGFRARVTFAEGAQRTAEWYRREGLLPHAATMTGEGSLSGR